jgi:hypothetical protein
MAWNTVKWRAVVLDFLERAGWSAGEIFFATLLAGGTVVSVANLPWKYALTLALSAAVSSIVLTAVQYLTKQTNLPFWYDLLVRLAKTFLGSLGASFGAAKVFDVTTFHWGTALNIAALATLGALGKGLLARQQQSGGPASVPAAEANPSTLPTKTYVEAVE